VRRAVARVGGGGAAGEGGGGRPESRARGQVGGLRGPGFVPNMFNSHITTKSHQKQHQFNHSPSTFHTTNPNHFQHTHGPSFHTALSAGRESATRKKGKRRLTRSVGLGGWGVAALGRVDTFSTNAAPSRRAPLTLSCAALRPVTRHGRGGPWYPPGPRGPPRPGGRACLLFFAVLDGSIPKNLKNPHRQG